MNCPLCIDQSLEVMHRGGIEVDVCPKCRGIWLDRGEIDRLAADPATTSRPSRDRTREKSGRDRSEDHRKKKKKRKKQSLADRIGDALEDVLDL